MDIARTRLHMMRKAAALSWKGYALAGLGGSAAGLLADALINSGSNWKSKLKAAGVGAGVGLAGAGIYDLYSRLVGGRKRNVDQMRELALRLGVPQQEVDACSGSSGLMSVIDSKLKELGKNGAVDNETLIRLHLRLYEPSTIPTLKALMQNQVQLRALSRGIPVAEAKSQLKQELFDAYPIFDAKDRKENVENDMKFSGMNRAEIESLYNERASDNIKTMNDFWDNYMTD